MNRVNVRIRYKAGGGDPMLGQLNSELRDEYFLQLRPDSRPQADRSFDAIVDIFLNISFEDFFKIVRDGVIWDVLTRGKDSFVLKPVIREFQELEKINTKWDYSCIRIMFDDTEILLYGIANMFTSNVGVTMNAIAKHYSNVIDKALGSPYQIIVPLTKKIDEQGITFINWGSGSNYELSAYTGFWGVAYKLGYVKKVYDVEANKFVADDWRK